MSRQILNPYIGAPDTGSRIWTNLSPEVFNYFFRGVFAGGHGQRQAIINTLIEALYQECKRIGLQPVYDPDNEPRVAAILANTNFRPTPIDPPKRKAKPAARRKHDAGAVDGLCSRSPKESA